MNAVIEFERLRSLARFEMDAAAEAAAAGVSPVARAARMAAAAYIQSGIALALASGDAARLAEFREMRRENEDADAAFAAMEGAAW